MRLFGELSCIILTLTWYRILLRYVSNHSLVERSNRRVLRRDFSRKNVDASLNRKRTSRELAFVLRRTRGIEHDAPHGTRRSQSSHDDVTRSSPRRTLFRRGSGTIPLQYVLSSKTPLAVMRGISMAGMPTTKLEQFQYPPTYSSMSSLVLIVHTAITSCQSFNPLNP